MTISIFDVLSFIFYALLIFLPTYLIVSWRFSTKLEQEKQRLEQIVKERAKEVYEKNERLLEQSQKLRKMDRVKSRFFANISHEFRTPLTLILSPLENMLSHSRDKRQRSELNMMVRNAQRLLTLINQLLDLSRIDSGEMKLQPTHQNVVPFLKGILDSFNSLAQQNQLELQFEPEKEDISFYFDSQQLERVMYNLLINAVKFTPPGGKVTVAVSRFVTEKQFTFKSLKEPNGKYVEIIVRDTGIGIAPEQIGHIFNRFYQLENFQGKGLKGTGIGLALAKEIVALHHGIIDVHSEVGSGTEFVMHFLMGKGHFKSEEITKIPIGPQEQHIFKQYTFQAEFDEYEPLEVKKITPEKEKEEAPIILVVEDNNDIRRYIRESLENDYTVFEAVDGKQGIEIAKEKIPDLIVSDIMMPEVDGYELCQVLKRDFKTSHIPIILLTAKASEESVLKGLETGADDYVFKPFNTRILLGRIKNLIESRRQLQLKIQRTKMLLPKKISASSSDEKFLREFQSIIEKNFSDPDFNVDILCKQLYMGRSTLFRKIQTLTGETPNEFILSYRLERAAQLLRSNYGNVTEVAFNVGFSSSSFFSKCFKKKFFQSPISYQKLWISR